MEINTGAKPAMAGQPAQPERVAATEAAQTRQKLPPIEAKAPPKVAEFQPKDIDKAVEDLQNFVEALGRDLSFRRDDSINKSIITVRDANTNQLVRQIPAEEVVEVARQIKESMDKLRTGVLMNGEA
tara:strand:- start:304 stop:684 length:381 start_codon:yes stop_codon:yes gene_type:complete